MPWEFNGENLVYNAPPETAGYTWRPMGQNENGTNPEGEWVKNENFDPTTLLNGRVDKYGRLDLTPREDLNAAEQRAYQLAYGGVDPSKEQFEVKSIDPNFSLKNNLQWWNIDPAYQDWWVREHSQNKGGAIGTGGGLIGMRPSEYITPAAILAGGALAAYTAPAAAGGFGLTGASVPSLIGGLELGAGGAAGAGGFGLTGASIGGIGLTGASVPSLASGLELGTATANSAIQQAAINAAKGAALGGTKNALTGQDILTGAALGALGGGISSGVSSALDLGTTGNIIGGSLAGGAKALAVGTDPFTGLLSGAIGSGVNAGINTGVDAAANSGLFDNVISQANTGNTQMDELFGPTYADLGYDPYANLNAGDVEAQQGGYYGGVAPENPYTNMSDEQIASAISAQSGTDPNTALSLVKSLGSTVVKSLLGGTATTAQKALAQNTGLGSLLGGATNVYLTDQQRQAIQNAYNTQSQAVRGAATQAQNLAAFTPIGTTNFFGSSQFQVDPTTGKLVSAGYTPTAQVAGQMQNLFGLGAQALPTTADTQAIQQQYIAQQQGLLAPGREQQLAQLQNKQFQTGRTGLATGGTMTGYAPGQAGLMQTNPELAAYYNSIGQQNAQLAANAPTYAQDLLNKQIATGTGLFGSANTLQGYAQQPFTMSSDLAKAQAAAGASAGQLGLTGQTNAAQLASTGSLLSNAAMQGTYNQLGQTATGLGNQIGGMLLQNPTIANWLS